MSVLRGRTLAAGHARAELARLSQPLSLWGGLDLAQGTVCDVTHPELGLSLRGKVVAMTSVRGSSSSSSALVEAIRRGTAPVGILLQHADPILVMGSLVGAELYGVEVPIVLLDRDAWQSLDSALEVSVDAAADGATVRLKATGRY